MDLKIFKYKVSTSVIAVLLTVVSFFVTIMFVVFFKVEDKTISIINFYEQEIKVNIRNTEYAIEPFDTKEITLNTSLAISVKVTDKDGKDLKDFKVENLARGSQLISIALSSNDGYCFFSSGLSTDASSNVVLKNPITLSSNPVNYVISDTNPVFTDYVYPGKVFTIDQTKYTKPVIYVYPISCNLITDSASLIKTISAFSDYNAADQLKYLQDTRAKINGADSIDNLDSSIPTKVDKYYVSEDKYVFVYE